MYITPILYKV